MVVEVAFYLEKSKTSSTPYILVDEEKKYIQIKGESYGEHIIEHYTDLNEWLEDSFNEVCDGFTFDCEMSYFNSSTSKLLMDILLLIDDCAADGNSITVNWICEDGNDIIIECGEDYDDELEHLTFNLIIR